MKDRLGEWLRKWAYRWNEWLERREIAKNVKDYERRKIDEDPGQSEASKKASQRASRKKRDNSRSRS